MKAKRVDCADCALFIPPVPVEPDNLISDISKPGCKLGKRVMFRMPKRAHSQMSQDWGGWFRYCEDFNLISKEC